MNCTDTKLKLKQQLFIDQSTYTNMSSIKETLANNKLNDI